LSGQSVEDTVELAKVAAGLQKRIDMRKRHLFGWGLALALTVSATAIAAVRDDIAKWPENQRSFVQDGTVLLLGQSERKELLAATSAERDRLIEEFLGQDPFPDTPENELHQAIERRQQLVHEEFLTLLDDRAKVLFLRGLPLDRNEVECGMAFKPIEIWTYGTRARCPTCFSTGRQKTDPGVSGCRWRPSESFLFQRCSTGWSSGRSCGG
jgi:hypothetical protein